MWRLRCRCLILIYGYLNLWELLSVSAAWRTMRQTCRGGHSTQSSQLGQCCTREDTIPGRRDFWVGLVNSMCWTAHTSCRHLPKSYKHKPERRSLTHFIPSKSHVRPTHCPTPAKRLFLRIIYSQDFFSQDYFLRILWYTVLITLVGKVWFGWVKRQPTVLQSFAINVCEIYPLHT